MKKKTIAIKISPDDEKFFEKFLKETLSLFAFTPEGYLPVSFLFNFDIRFQIIYSKISIIGVEINKEELWKLIFEVLKKFKDDGNDCPTFENLKEELKNHLMKFQKTKSNEYCLFFALHTSGNYVWSKKWFNVLGDRFYRSNIEKIKLFPGWKEFRNSIVNSSKAPIDGKKRLEKIDNMVPLIISVKAQNSKRAFEKANGKFNLLRSILNFSHKSGQFTYQFSAPNPLGLIYPSPLYGVFNSDGKYEESFWTIEQYDYEKKKPISKKEIEASVRLLKQIESINDYKLRNLIIDSLMKYGQVLDTIDWEKAFLLLWQILENLSLCSLEDVFNMNNVVNRIIILIGQDDTLSSLLLKSLKNTRNKLVHKGIFPDEGLREVNLLKYVVDCAMGSLFKNLKKFPTRDLLKAFFNYEPKNNNYLKNQKKIIDTILRFRNQN